MTLTWPADVSDDLDRIRRAREQLLTAGLLAPRDTRAQVRAEIERSWRRCIGEAVPTRRDDVHYRDPADLQPRLRSAAEPVLSRLGEELGQVKVAMFLSDQTSRIIMRRASEPSQRSVFDRACAAEGFDFSETSIGTNGLGTVIEERRPLVVHGSEHYNERLETITCTGTPIFEPFTRQLVGSFALSSHAAEATPLMCALTTEVGRQIEANLAAMLGAHERTLIHSYLLATRRDRDPVIVVTESSAFANTAGLNHVTAEAHALLWVHLNEAELPRGAHRIRVPMPNGCWDAVVEHVDGPGGPSRSAYCVRLLTEATCDERTAPSTPAVPTPALHPLPDVHAHLVETIRFGETLVVDGPPGSGKLHVALAALARRTGSRPQVLECADGRPTLPATGGIVLRHLQDLDPRALTAVKLGIERAAGPVAVTVDLDAADEPVRALVAQLGTPVRLPALREMPTQLPGLVTAILAELPRGTRFSSAALQQLMRWSWPGNVAELRRTVEHLARRHPGRVVGVLDLPTRLRDARPHGRTLMESAERDVIVTALRRAGGNRSKAAAELGIGRTTLYRKIQAHRIDG